LPTLQKTTAKIQTPHLKSVTQTLLFRIHLALLGSLFVLSPLFLSGKPPLPQMMIVLLGLALSVTLILMREGLKPLKHLILVLLIALPILQLIPIHYDLWKTLPGREAYAILLLKMNPEVIHHALPLTLIPSHTQLSLGMMLTFVAVVMAIMAQSSDHIRRWTYLVMGIVFFESLLGLIQYGAGPQSFLRMGPGFGTPSAVGTYANRDHLAGLLEMALPLSIALLLISFRGTRTHSVGEALKHQLTSLRFNSTYIFLILSIVIILAILFTQSRAGVSLMLLGIFVVTLLFASRLGFKKVLGISGTTLFVALIAAIEVGIIPLLNRFILEDPLKDLRWPMVKETWLGFQYFFPFGSGLGTFPQVFERFQTPDLNGVFVNHAHNDVLEFMFEGGVIACAILLLFVLSYLRQWWRIWPKGDWHRYHYLQIGAGVSIMLMMLHSLVDFNLHTPANLIYFAFIVGLFFHPTLASKTHT
jgi:O-antigen ligase